MSKGTMGIGKLGMGMGMRIKRKWYWTLEGKDITGDVTLPETRVKLSHRPIADIFGIATHEITLIVDGRNSYHDLSTDIAIIRLYDGGGELLETWVLDDIKKFFRREGCQFDYYDEPALEYTLEYGRSHYTSALLGSGKLQSIIDSHRPIAPDQFQNIVEPHITPSQQKSAQESMAQYKNKYVGTPQPVEVTQRAESKYVGQFPKGKYETHSPDPDQW